VFSSADNTTLIIAIKGTSAAILGGGGPTATRDKINVSCLLLLPFGYGWGLVVFRFCLLRFVICHERKEKGGKG
jgi:putative lipase involved disintegration of autophagic bodies